MSYLGSYKKYFLNQVNKIKDENRYRSFVPIKRIADQFPFGYYKEKKKITFWCINDYLGMTGNPYVIKAALNSIEQGIGSGGTRNIGGNHNSIVKLEEIIARLHNKEKALVFTSGYIANDATISIIGKIVPNLVFLSDELNHASIISGINNSKLQKIIFKHNNVNDLEKKLSQLNLKQPKMIIFESVYSMNGNISDIKQICNLAKKYNAMTYIDEVHSVGLYGKKGAGLAQMLNCEDKIDIIQGTLSKAYGVIGGYIAGNNELIDSIRLTARGLIFTTSLPPIITNSAIASIEYLSNSNIEREKLHNNVKKVKLGLKKLKINFVENQSHIISIIIGDPVVTEKISSILLEKYNIYIQHINFPTVAKGTERLRITPTSGHNDEMIEDLLDKLSTVLSEVGILEKENYRELEVA